MPDNSDRPLSILVAQGLALTASLVSLLLVVLSFLFDPPSLIAQGLYFGLLVVLPFASFIAALRRHNSAKHLLLLSLIAVWGFVLKAFWVYFGLDPSSPVLVILFIVITLSAIALPVLCLKLAFGKAEKEFFRESPAADDLTTLGRHIADRVTSLDEQFFNRHSEPTFKE